MYREEREGIGQVQKGGTERGGNRVGNTKNRQGRKEGMGVKCEKRGMKGNGQQGRKGTRQEQIKGMVGMG